MTEQVITHGTSLPGIHVCGQGPAIILLHSSLSSAKQWLPLVAELKSDHTLINIDILGYGQAPQVTNPEHYNFDVEVKRIQAAVSTVIGEQNYHLVGHSCGGAIALKLAVQAPEKLLSLSLYEPVAFHLFELGSEERKISDSFAEQVEAKDNVEAAIAFTDFWNQPGFYQALPTKMQQLMASDMPKVKLDFKGLISESYGFTEIAKVKCASLIMSGKFSPSLSVSLANGIASSLERGARKSFKAGHMAPISHAKEVQTYIADFIKSI